MTGFLKPDALPRPNVAAHRRAARLRKATTVRQYDAAAREIASAVRARVVCAGAPEAVRVCRTCARIADLDTYALPVQGAGCVGCGTDDPDWKPTY